MSTISAQYSKEIDTLRQQLGEAKSIIDSNERTKLMTQENLKRAFMKGMCSMNMEAASILNNSEEYIGEKNFQTMAEGVFSESTPARQLAFNNSTSSDDRVYDSNLKEKELFTKFGINISEANESEKSENEGSIHQTPTNRNMDNIGIDVDEKELKAERKVYTELETASMSKVQKFSSGVKISKPGNDIIINNTKIESKDNQWKPAPVMQQDPIIVNNVKAHNTGYKSVNLSYNEKSSLPKPILGMYSNQEKAAGASFADNLKEVVQPQNNNNGILRIFNSI